MLVGKEFVVSPSTCNRAGRIAHAYLFSGPRGVGKTSSARILARARTASRAHGYTLGVVFKCGSLPGHIVDVSEIVGASNSA
jgi:DNA polymerase-3 subunit gamma/tau